MAYTLYRIGWKIHYSRKSEKRWIQSRKVVLRNSIKVDNIKHTKTKMRVFNLLGARPPYSFADRHDLHWREIVLWDLYVFDGAVCIE